jgi:hypothetical protein
MDFLGAFGVVLGVGLALLVVLFARRLLIARGGTVEVSVRLYRGRRGRGWALGMARFSGDELRWYRLFSFAARPRRILNRKQLSILGRRDPDGTERLALLSGSVVVECATKDGPIELAMDMGAFTGFLSWLEAAGGRAGFPPYAA